MKRIRYIKCNKRDRRDNNPFPKYSYNSGLITQDGNKVYGVDNKWLLWEIRHGYGLSRI